ncbi:hypothetical protein LZ32DRAFT_372639 [Colletotrichum eremochloae]|nr:hypothetical protein LZ32DRAFT_372639 [Colletotrichum eremochloae]
MPAFSKRLNHRPLGTEPRVSSWKIASRICRARKCSGSYDTTPLALSRPYYIKYCEHRCFDACLFLSYRCDEQEPVSRRSFFPSKR